MQAGLVSHCLHWVSIGAALAVPPHSDGQFIGCEDVSPQNVY